MTHEGNGKELSFRDKLMGGKVAPPPSPHVDLIAKKLVRIEIDKENPMIPNVLVADSVIKSSSVPWEDALIIKLLDKDIGYIVMKKKLQSLW